jgi:hypothetical protein
MAKEGLVEVQVTIDQAGQQKPAVQVDCFATFPGHLSGRGDGPDYPVHDGNIHPGSIGQSAVD